MSRTPVTYPSAVSLDGHARTRRARLLGLCQLGAGLSLTLRPRQVAAYAAGPRGQAAPTWLVRILGVRSLVQGTATIARPTSGVLAVGALVDATHAASMAPVIVLGSCHRRAASLSAVAAVLSAAVAARSADLRPAAEGVPS